jgi:hypothetical protein
MLHYWYLIYAKVFWDSLHFADKTGEGLCFDVLVCVFGVLIPWIKNRDKAMTWKKFFFEAVPEGLAVGLAAYLLVFFGHLLWAPYQLQSDADRERDGAVLARDQAQSDVGTLKADGKSKDAKIDDINGKLSTTFTQLAQSQGVINNLGTQVAKFNQPEPFNLTLLTMGSLYPDKTKGLHSNSLLVLSNKTVTPVNATFLCAGYIDDLNAMIVGSGGMMGGSNRLFGNSYHLQIQTPAWSPISPLLVTIYFNEDDPGACTLRPQSVPK